MADSAEKADRNPRPIETIELTKAQQQAAFGLMKWTLDYLYSMEYHLCCEPDKLASVVQHNSPRLIHKLSLFVRDVTGSERDEQGNSYFF